MGNWFPYRKWNGEVVRCEWLAESPAGRASRCDRCNRTVKRDERRLRVDDGLGPERKRGKGKRHSYLCVECARDVPDPESDQTQMF